MSFTTNGGSACFSTGATAAQNPGMYHMGADASLLTVALGPVSYCYMCDHGSGFPFMK